jgi:predicted TIM-barrel enzyme
MKTYFLGTPFHRPDQHNVEKLLDHCCQEAEIYSRLGLDSILVENMNDLPYLVSDEVGPGIGLIF